MTQSMNSTKTTRETTIAVLTLDFTGVLSRGRANGLSHAVVLSKSGSKALRIEIEGQ